MILTILIIWALTIAFIVRWFYCNMRDLNNLLEKDEEE